MTELYVALVHYPVYNKHMDVIASAVTNFDIHDISRTCRTYDVQEYYLVHPLEIQRDIIKKIIGYWQNGGGKDYNPDRGNALARAVWQQDIASCIVRIREKTGQVPVTITTDARVYPNTISYKQARSLLQSGSEPVLLILGTAFGIEASVMQSFDYILEPIYGCCDYNHLCVRGAAAVILDRLAGEAWWK